MSTSSQPMPPEITRERLLEGFKKIEKALEEMIERRTKLGEYNADSADILFLATCVSGLVGILKDVCENLP